MCLMGKVMVSGKESKFIFDVWGGGKIEGAPNLNSLFHSYSDSGTCRFSERCLALQPMCLTTNI